MHRERRDLAAAQPVEAHLPADGVGEAEPAPHHRVHRGIGEPVGRGVETEVAQEPLLGAENHAPHRRMDPVRADEQIGVENGAVVERDPHSLAVILDVHR